MTLAERLFGIGEEIGSESGDEMPHYYHGKYLDAYGRYSHRSGPSPLRDAVANYLDTREFDRIGIRSILTALRAFKSEKHNARLQRGLIERIQNSNLEWPQKVEDITTLQEGEVVAVVGDICKFVGIVNNENPLFCQGFDMYPIVRFHLDSGRLEYVKGGMRIISPSDPGFVHQDFTTGDRPEIRRAVGLVPQEVYRLPYKMLQEVPQQSLIDALGFPKPVLEAILKKVYTN